jgi:protein-S-isoprenylcysteine O-methyltransferase Ste14
VRPDTARAAAHRRVGWFGAGYAGLAGIVAVEALVRRPGAASDLHASTEDAGSTRGIAAAGVVAALSAPFLRRLPLRPLPAAVAPLGVLVLVAGMVLRVWSMQTLAESYSRTLRVTNQQTVTERGPYRRVRHPGYLGSLLVWTGFALTSGSAAVVAAVVALVAPAYVHRIEAEERLLERDLPGYGDYRGRTARLVPRLW